MKIANKVKEKEIQELIKTDSSLFIQLPQVMKCMWNLSTEFSEAKIFDTAIFFGSEDNYTFNVNPDNNVLSFTDIGSGFNEGEDALSNVEWVTFNYGKGLEFSIENSKGNSVRFLIAAGLLACERHGV